MLVVILMSWAIWTTRNDLIFKNQQASVSAAKETFKELTCSRLEQLAKLKISLTY
jgi:hypothetical protein